MWSEKWRHSRSKTSKPVDRAVFANVLEASGRRKKEETS